MSNGDQEIYLGGDKTFSVGEKQSEAEVLENMARVANKLGMEGWRVHKMVGPYTKVDSDDHIYILKCQRQ